MKLKWIILEIFTLMSLLAIAEPTTITVYGKVVDSKGKYIPNVTISIQSPPDAKFQAGAKGISDSSGYFKIPVSISDTTRTGALIISWQNCTGNLSTNEIHFNPAHTEIEINLVYCAVLDPVCYSSITTKKINDTLGIAVVNTKGKAPFNYKWTTGDDNDTIYYDLRKSEKYCVKVIDSMGCVSDACFSHIPVILCSSTVISKKINDTLAIAYAVTIGKAPFKYQWTQGQTTDTIFFDPNNKDKHCVRVVDAKGCVSEACVNAILPDCLVKIIQDGKTLVALYVGDSAVSYKWNNGKTTSKITVDSAGEYCVTVVSQHGCEAKACFVYRLPILCKDSIIAEIVSASDSSNTKNYRLTVKANYPLNFIQWSTGENKASFVTKTPGKYCVYISDNLQCKNFICKEIGDPVQCTLSIKKDTLPASNTNAGKKIKLTAITSFTPKLYFWSTGETTPSILVEKSGEYCVTASDGVSCKQITCIKIDLGTTTPPASCSAAIVVKPISTKEVKLSVKVDGNSPLVFKWSTGATSSSISAKVSGQYCVTLIDGTGCTAKSCVIVDLDTSGNGILSPDKSNAGLIANENSKIQTLLLYPNPSGDKVNISIQGHIPGEGMISVVNLYGKQVYQEKVKVGTDAYKDDLDLSFLPAGVYQIVFEQKYISIKNKLVIAR